MNASISPKPIAFLEVLLKTGIVSYGVALPKYRIDAQEIWRVWKNLATSFFDMLSIGERGCSDRKKIP